MKRSLNAQQKKFVELMCEDKLYTNEQLASHCEVDVRTIYRWKRDDAISSEIEKTADAGLKGNMNRAYGVLTEILFNSESEALKLKALELFLKTQGKLKDKSESEVKVKVSSVEEAEAELDKLLDM